MEPQKGYKRKEQRELATLHVVAEPEPEGKNEY
jgi:hypothetical protein